YKEHRTLLHTGKVVRVDTREGRPWMHGVVAPDATAALMACVQFEDGLNTTPARMTIPGLLPERQYRVRSVQPPTEVALSRADRVPRLPEEGAVVSGAVLARVGVTMPRLCPLQIVLL
ncbi:GH36 C-terminal domain-containing protein, partial [Streptomyces sp. DT225]